MNRDSVYQDYFKNDKQKQTQWKVFLKKNKLSAENNFESAIDKIQNFLEPIFSVRSPSDELTENKIWNPETWSWK